MKKWYQHRGMPWIFLGGMLAIGAIGLIAGVAVGVASPEGSDNANAAITFTTIWLLVGVLITPLSLALSIVWAALIRRKPTPEEMAGRNARSAESAARALQTQSANAEARRLRAESKAASRQQREAAAQERRQQQAAAARAKAAEISARDRMPPPPSTRRVAAVQVAFLNGLEPKNAWQTYTYSWPFSETPSVGDYVVVPGGTLTKIMALGTGDYDGELKSITRVATTRDIANAARGRGVRFQ